MFEYKISESDHTKLISKRKSRIERHFWQQFHRNYITFQAFGPSKWAFSKLTRLSVCKVAISMHK